MLGHNEDNGGSLIMRHRYVPRGTGAELSFEDGAAKIKQAGPTCAFLWMETLRPAPGESFGDTFVNEMGVAITSNSCGKSREDSPELRDGGIGWGLRWIAAGSAKSARDAVRIASELVLEYGYRSSARSYTFADKDEIWFFQVVNGKHFAAQRVPDDHIAVNSNHYTIRTVDPDDAGNYLLSPGLVEYAAGRGWYSPRKPGASSDFDFAAAFQRPDFFMAASNVPRHVFGLRLAAGEHIDADAPEARLPFSVKPASPLTWDTLRGTLSCHCERPDEDGKWKATPHTAKPFDAEIDPSAYARICNGNNRESVIVDFRENTGETTVWSCFGNPCILPMIPWRLGSRAVPASLSGVPDDGDAPCEMARKHFTAAESGLQSLAPEAWNISREFVRRVDEEYPMAAEKHGKWLNEITNEIKSSNDRFEDSVSPEKLLSQAAASAELAARAIEGFF
jgi:dipeptidase